MILPHFAKFQHEMTETNEIPCDSDSRDVSIQMADIILRMNSLKIPDLQLILEQRANHLHSVIESFDLMIGPILLLAQNVIRYSDSSVVDEQVEVLNSVMELWNNIKNVDCWILELSKSFKEDIQKLNEVSTLLSQIENLELQTRILITNLISLAELQEIDQEEDFDSTTAYQDQERSRQFTNFVSKVIGKIQGKDNPNMVQLSVEHQVDQIINEATDSKQLCQMFEGFMGWF